MQETCRKGWGRQGAARSTRRHTTGQGNDPASVHTEDALRTTKGGGQGSKGQNQKAEGERERWEGMVAPADGCVA